VPVIYQGQEADYDFYLRNDPRKLDNKVPIVGDIVFRKNMVLNVTTENLFCNGYWNLALSNLYDLYNIMEVDVLIWKENENYSPEKDYMFVTFNEANVSEIRKEKNVYNLNVNNCEVLEVAERLMVETFRQFKELNG
jgi:hypothetical protein